LTWLCKKFKVYKSGYYFYVQKKASKQAKKDEVMFHVDRVFHTHDGVAGYKKVHRYLQQEGFNYSVEYVRILMKDAGLQSITQAKKKFSAPGKYCEAFQNKVKNRYNRRHPNRLWFTDFTYIRLSNGKFVYVCIILDAFDLSVIAFKVSHFIDAQLAIDTLDIALRKTKPRHRVILHSDQGVQYRAKKFTTYCKNHHIIQSMSRIGTPTDNAVMESFMGKLKCERTKHREYETSLMLTEDLLYYIYSYYNTKRIHQSLGYKTPVAFRNAYLTKITA
jgi:putative transposase